MKGKVGVFPILFSFAGLPLLGEERNRTFKEAARLRLEGVMVSCDTSGCRALRQMIPAD